MGACQSNERARRMDDKEQFLRQTIATYDAVAAQYVERHRTSGWWDKLNPNIQRLQNQLKPGSSVLDLGCGPGVDSFKLRAVGYTVTGADLSWGMLAQAQQYAGNHLIQMDMRALGLAAHSFDAVWMQAALLHLPRVDTPTALCEIQRVLRADGLLALSVKQGEGEGYQHVLGERYFVYYQPDEIQTLVEQAGFRIVENWQDTVNQTAWIGLMARKI